MSNESERSTAIAMIVRFDRHQHPECYGDTDVAPEFPEESVERVETLTLTYRASGEMLAEGPPPSEAV